MAVERSSESGDIQYREDVAVRRVARHRGGTGPGLDARGEMRRGVDVRRPPRGQGRANGVRAAGQLVPVRPDLQADETRGVDRGGIAFGLEDHAARISENHDRPRLRQDLAGLRHDGDARLEEIPVARLQRGEILVQQWRGSLREDRVNPGGTTALPGTLDQATHRAGSQRAVLEEALPRRHGPSVVMRLRRACERLLVWDTVPSKR